jgi:hypothetical protein
MELGITCFVRQLWESAYGMSAIRPKHTLSMSREVNIGSRKFWIVSEPHDKGWKAQVLEVVDDLGGTHNVGIETTGETRSMADDRAIGQLQHRLRDQSF